MVNIKAKMLALNLRADQELVLSGVLNSLLFAQMQFPVKSTAVTPT